MKNLLEKITSYNIFNYLFPGIIFCSLSDSIAGYKLLVSDLIIGVFVYYFIGLIISRIGSLIIEPFLKAIKILNFAKYSDYIEASKSDPKLEILSENNNMYRTIISIFLSLVSLRIYGFLEIGFPCLVSYRWLIVSIFIIILFAYSYKKQTKYIFNRVYSILKKEV